MRRLSTRQYAEALLDLTESTPHDQWPVLFDEFLKTLQKRRSLKLLPLILDRLEAIERERQGIVAAHVTTSRPLKEVEVQTVREALESLFKKQIELKTSVDHQLLGGVVVQSGDQLIDASVRRRIDSLHRHLVES